MIKTIFYRGWIDFCNFHCSYCPFSKNAYDEKVVQKEMEELKKFYDYLNKIPEEINVVICPYGEALYHSFYQDFLITVTKLPNINAIGIQTNLSLSVDNFIKKLEILAEKSKKIYLWATWHSEYENIDSFVQKVTKLSTKVKISAGVVANKKNHKEIFELRNKLPADVYLWINAMEQRRNKFNEIEIKELEKVDPMFPYEFKINREKYFSICSSYENIYVDRGFYSSRCFFKKSKNLGENCHDHKNCDCYLGYSNFLDSPIRKFFGDNFCFRNPDNFIFK